MNLFRFSAAIALVALFALAVPTFAADGAAVYTAKCAVCHAADGSGNTPMGKKLTLRHLASPEVQKQTEDALVLIIAKGKGKMPSYGSKLSDAEIKAVVAHIRSLAAR